MGVRHSVSRRHMLAMSAAAGSLAIHGGFHAASAQGGKRRDALVIEGIERLDPSLDAIIDTSQLIQELASGLGGELGPPKGRSGGRRAATCYSVTSATTVE
jgi:hypothetical protein